MMQYERAREILLKLKTANWDRPLIAAVIIAGYLTPTPSLAGKKDGDWLGPYPPLSVVFADIESMARERPDLVQIDIIGRSVEDRPIYAVHVSKNDGADRPEALITANIHAGEVISSRVVLGAAWRLIRGEGKDPWITSLLERTDFWIVPMQNPDGYHRVISLKGNGDKRKNANGVDLNRNYPVAPGAKSSHPMSGNRRPNSTYYMGPEQLSEPETRAIARLADEHDFYVALNCHSVAGKFLYPHGFTRKPARHVEEFKEIGQAFADAQGRWKYKVQVSYSWYPTLGDSDDFMYLYHGAPSFTVEHGRVGYNLRHALFHWPAVFWIFNPKDPEAWVDNDADALLAAVEKALEITGGKPYDPKDLAPPN